jgi:ribonuclease III family protein
MSQVTAIHPRALAHLGDAVYELHVRQLALVAAQQAGSDQLDWLHRYTTQRVSAVFQSQLLPLLQPWLSPTEAALLKRARNLPVSINKRANQQAHRNATAFEALVGELSLTDQSRLTALWDLLSDVLQVGMVAVGDDNPL